MPFIVFDGLDGAGKTTQVEMLQKRLEASGRKVVVINHPRHEGLGKVVRNLLHVQKQRFSPWVESFLYAADQAETCEKVIAEAKRESGIHWSNLDGDPSQATWVLAHRWVWSSLVFQALLDGAELRDVVNLSGLVVEIGVAYADMNLIMVADPKVVEGRIMARNEASVSPYENLEALTKAHAAFTSLVHGGASVSPESLAATFGPTQLIDTTHQTPDETHGCIVQAIESTKYLKV